MPAEIIPGALPVAASTTFYEVVTDAAVDFPFADGDNAWPPRNFTLEYNGVQEVYDEFGRRVLAYVFRFPDMVFVQDSMTFTADGIDIDGHYEEHDFEVHFDASDGHWISVIDRTDLQRFFPGPDWRLPTGPVPMEFMLLHAMGLDPSQEIYLYNFTDQDGIKRDAYIHFERFTKFRPLKGDCDMWTAEMRYDPPRPKPLAPEVPSVDAQRDYNILCLKRGELIPLWSWWGTRDEEKYRLERTSPGFLIPDHSGETLNSVQYALKPWSDATGPVPLPQLGPTKIPPMGGSSDWSGHIRDRVRALYLSPSFVQFRAASETPWVDFMALGMPVQPVLTVAGVPVPPAPLGFDSMAVALVTDNKNRHFGIIYSRDANPEQPSLHIAAAGANFAAWYPSATTAATLPLLPSAEDLAMQLHALVLDQPDRITFALLDFEDFEVGAVWVLTEPCHGREEGQSVIVEGMKGYVWVMKIYDPAREPCEREDLGLRVNRPLPLRMSFVDNLRLRYAPWMPYAAIQDDPIRGPLAGFLPARP